MESSDNPLAEYPYISAVTTPYVTPELSKHTDWDKEVKVQPLEDVTGLEIACLS